MKRVLLSVGLLMSIVILSACGQKKDDTGGIDIAVKPTDNVAEKNQPGTIKEVPSSVETGDTVTVSYVGALENGEIFDTNIVEEAKKAGTYNDIRPYEPLAFTVGKGNMIPGFEKGVVGMAKGETKVINIPAAEGYGPVREEMIVSEPISKFEEGGVDWQSWKIGETYTFENRFQGTVVEITETDIRIDFNHFLAGKDLTFTVTVEDINR